MPEVTIDLATLRILTHGSSSQERCSVATEILQQPDFLPGFADLAANKHPFQVRLRHDGEDALYSVVAFDDDDNPNTVRMGAKGRLRLGITGVPSAGSVSHQVLNQAGDPRPRLTEHLRKGSATFLVVLAPHGGAIEIATDKQALRVIASPDFAANSVTAWYCLGTGPGAHDRWHITSTDISEHSFPRLKQIACTCYTQAVSFHGFESSTITEDVLIGGLASDALKDKIKAEIEARAPHLAATVAERGLFAGKEARNLVNRLSRGNGIQIEQSPRARESGNWELVADAVASVYAALAASGC